MTDKSMSEAPEWADAIIELAEQNAERIDEISGSSKSNFSLTPESSKQRAKTIKANRKSRNKFASADPASERSFTLDPRKTKSSSATRDQDKSAEGDDENGKNSGFTLDPRKVD